MRSAAKAFFFAFRVALLALLLPAVAPHAASAQEWTLYMVEQPGCIYCARWDEEVGDAYHLTAEGKAAPLARVDLRAPLPEGVTFARKAVFTPTFVLVRDGQEIDRIEGYPGEDFFYGLLGVMLKNAGATVD
ncbi:thioredoxin family protein [Pseudorhodobacter sp. E13]|uniref:thioredoxin family protein n=1 Tax=Pseudorhodobacter sp. E13 TaxID=2487931 RepID=UPI000F8D65A2|nr:thioredoxin family protein [Pseudorhodobacter sp. E13]RUS59648.1 thioredoxin family protein [Pseudorhodobacter sp. E13]